jgi:hypothetical protein
MKRIFAVLSVATVLTVAAFAQTPQISAKANCCNSCCTDKCGDCCSRSGCAMGCCQGK